MHVLESSERALDASRVMGESDVRERLAELDRIFGPARIGWALEQLLVERPASDEPFRQALAGRKTPRALPALVRAETRLSPRGFDLYVARDLSPVGVGGAYLCSVDRQRGHGAAFVAAEGPGGKPQAVRKWAHELGHALGLKHTPCEPAYADRLMMSARCEHAEPERVGLSELEIARLRKQATSGGPAPCGTLDQVDEGE